MGWNMFLVNKILILSQSSHLWRMKTILHTVIATAEVLK